MSTRRKPGLRRGNPGGVEPLRSLPLQHGKDTISWELAMACLGSLSGQEVSIQITRSEQGQKAGAGDRILTLRGRLRFAFGEVSRGEEVFSLEDPSKPPEARHRAFITVSQRRTERITLWTEDGDDYFALVFDEGDIAISFEDTDRLW